MKEVFVKGLMCEVGPGHIKITIDPKYFNLYLAGLVKFDVSNSTVNDIKLLTLDKLLKSVSSSAIKYVLEGLSSLLLKEKEKIKPKELIETLIYSLSLFVGLITYKTDPPRYVLMVLN